MVGMNGITFISILFQNLPQLCDNVVFFLRLVSWGVGYIVRAFGTSTTTIRNILELSPTPPPPQFHMNLLILAVEEALFNAISNFIWPIHDNFRISWPPLFPLIFLDLARGKKYSMIPQLRSIWSRAQTLLRWLRPIHGGFGVLSISRRHITVPKLLAFAPYISGVNEFMALLPTWQFRWHVEMGSLRELIALEVPCNAVDVSWTTRKVI